MKPSPSILIVVLIIFSVKLAYGVTLAPANLPSYQQGDTFIFDNYRVEHVVYAEQSTIEWRSRRDHHYHSDRNFIIPILQAKMASRSNLRKVIGNPDELWPLKPGNQTRFSIFNEANDSLSHTQVRELQLWHCYVEPQKRIQIAAGNFTTYPILCDQYSANSMRPFKRLTWFYSPTIGHYIRRQSINLVTGETTAFSLFATLPGSQANAPRIQALLDNIDLSIKK